MSDFDAKCASLGISMLIGRCQIDCGAVERRFLRKVRSSQADFDMWTLLNLFNARASLHLMFSFRPKGLDDRVVLMYFERTSCRLMLRWFGVSEQAFLCCRGCLLVHGLGKTVIVEH